jgi:hypothetical protein
MNSSTAAAHFRRVSRRTHTNCCNSPVSRTGQRCAVQRLASLAPRSLSHIATLLATYALVIFSRSRETLVDVRRGIIATAHLAVDATRGYGPMTFSTQPPWISLMDHSLALSDSNGWTSARFPSARRLLETRAHGSANHKSQNSKQESGEPYKTKTTEL